VEGINLQHVNQSSQISSKLEELFIKEETDNAGTISLNKKNRLTLSSTKIPKRYYLLESVTIWYSHFYLVYVIVYYLIYHDIDIKINECSEAKPGCW
jgi:hypothetical protein